MSDLFKFQQEEEYCEEVCVDCTLVAEYTTMALNSDSEEEVFEILMGLFQIGKEEGYKQNLRESIYANMSLLDALEECEHCDCEEECELKD